MNAIPPDLQFGLECAAVYTVYFNTLSKVVTIGPNHILEQTFDAMQRQGWLTFRKRHGALEIYALSDQGRRVLEAISEEADHD